MSSGPGNNACETCGRGTYSSRESDGVERERREKYPKRTDDMVGFLRMIKQMVDERAPKTQIGQYINEAVGELRRDEIASGQIRGLRQTPVRAPESGREESDDG